MYIIFDSPPLSVCVLYFSTVLVSITFSCSFTQYILSAFIVHVTLQPFASELQDSVQLWGMKANITSRIESDCSGHVGHIELHRGAVSLSAAEKQFQQLFKVAPSRWLFQNILLIRYLVDIWGLSRESLFVSHLASLKLISG